MSNVVYSFDGSVGYGKLPNGMVFRFDRDAFHKISNVKWYASCESGRFYIID